MFALEILTGLIGAIGAVGAVFWLTFRDPPARRPADRTAAIAPNREAEALIQSFSDHGHGGFGP